SFRNCWSDAIRVPKKRKGDPDIQDRLVVLRGDQYFFSSFFSGLFSGVGGVAGCFSALAPPEALAAPEALSSWCWLPLPCSLPFAQPLPGEVGFLSCAVAPPEALLWLFGRFAFALVSRFLSLSVVAPADALPDCCVLAEA